MCSPYQKLILAASLLATVGDCVPPDELQTASNQSEITYVGANLVPFVWNRPLATGERLYVQALRFRQCAGGSNPTQIYSCASYGFDKFMKHIDSDFSASAVQSNVTAEDALEVEVISTAGPSASVRLKLPSGRYLRLENDPFTTYARFSRFVETPNQAEATPIFLQGQAYGSYGAPYNTGIKYFKPGDPYTSVGCGFMTASGAGWSLPMNLYCGQEWKSGGDAGVDMIHGVWMKPVKNSFNLAQGRPTKQSSTYNTAGQSFYAVDGNIDGYYNTSVTHTESEYQAFWEVDLQSVQAIGRVLVHNRKDCCSERLRKFWVRVSTNGIDWQSQYFGGVAGPVELFEFNTPGRYVRVQLSEQNALSLAEVQVLSQYENVALNKPTVQSTTAYGGDSARAVDGKMDGTYANGSVTHTEYQANPTWEVDLQASYAIDKVLLYNRTDGGTERLSNPSLYISTDGITWLWAGWYSGAVPGVASITVGGRARYLRVKLPATNFLSLAEVVVLSTGPS